MAPIRLCLLIRQLNQGGAQRQLVELVAGLDKRRYAVSVVTFYSGGVFERELRAIPGVTLVCLDKRGRWDLAGFAWRLATQLRALAPDVLHGYLPTANLLAVAARPLLRDVRVVWGIRSSDMDLARYDWLTRVHGWLEAKFAGSADLIVLNSRAALDYHVRRGFPAENCLVVPNGIDTRRFSHDADAGREIRAEWGVDATTPLIGIVARLDPMKDHRTFLEAAARLRAVRDDVRFVCVGRAPAGTGESLREVAKTLGVEDAVIWAGAREDMPSAYAAFDVCTLCSAYGEGFPNVVAEAMSCGVPCVVTDVGDAAAIVGDTGVVVPPRRPDLLAEAWRSVLDDAGRADPERQARLRARVQENFDSARLIERTDAAIRRLVCGGGRES
jgi:glycosyltransferase involved in cell wall biosynthesis